MTEITVVKSTGRRRHPANVGRCKAKSHMDRGRTGTRYRCHLREKHDGAHQAPRGRETFRWWVS